MVFWAPIQMLSRLFSVTSWLIAAYLFGLTVAYAQTQQSETLRIGVASNFSQTATELIQVFERQSSIDTQLSIGSTGKITSQIEFGLQLDVFLAADSKRPAYLIDQGFVSNNKSITYAIGRLVLWSPRADLELNQESLIKPSLHHLALANPKLAPFGRAAHESLKSLNAWSFLKNKIVYGENVSQALQFALSGNAELALIAQSQFIALGRGSAWLVPANLHTPIIQNAVQLRASSQVSLFMQFLVSDTARAIIAKYGYELPHG